MGINSSDIFEFQVTYMLYWPFDFENEIPVNRLFTRWRWTWIFEFGPWRWSALNMGFVGLVAFKNARAMVFWKSDGRATVFGRVQKIWIFWTGDCSCPNPPPLKSSWGGGDLTSSKRETHHDQVQLREACQHWKKTPIIRLLPKSTCRATCALSNLAGSHNCFLLLTY